MTNFHGHDLSTLSLFAPSPSAHCIYSSSAKYCVKSFSCAVLLCHFNILKNSPQFDGCLNITNHMLLSINIDWRLVMYIDLSYCYGKYRSESCNVLTFYATQWKYIMYIVYRERESLSLATTQFFSSLCRILVRLGYADILLISILANGEQWQHRQ